MRRTVMDVMTRQVVVARESTPFKEIVRLMDEHGIGSLPVVDDDDDRRVVGVVSEADLLVKEEDPNPPEPGGLLGRRRRRTELRKAHALVAAQAMTSPAVVVSPEASLAEAARLMHQGRLKHLPVVDGDGRLVGIVSRSDLLRVFLRPDQEIQREVVEDVIARKLWIDPRTLEVRVRGGVVEVSGQVDRRSMIPVVVGLVRAVDGVVDVDDTLSYALDDTEIRPDGLVPWGVLPESLRYP